MPTTLNSILALDVGAKRVGIAIASLAARLPRPLTTLQYNDSFYKELQKIIATESINAIVIGLPRNLSGQNTNQTKATEEFVTELRQHISLPIHLQDEALTSQKAQTELQSRSKPYQRADIDALAATYILEDFLAAKDSAMKLRPAA